MLKDIYGEIKARKNVKDNLIKLKAEIKNPNENRVFRYMLAGDYEILAELMKHEDPKVRKNAALILGELEDDICVSMLFDAYAGENTLFVKPAYLKAMYKLDCRGYVDEFKTVRDELTSGKFQEDELKHVREQISLLNRLISKYEKNKKHTFKGYDEKYDIVLTTNREQVKVLADMLSHYDIRLLKAGVRLCVDDIRSILGIRIYNEILFPLSMGKTDCGRDNNGDDDAESDFSKPYDAAYGILNGNLKEILQKAHKDNSPYRFRVELRGIADRDEETAFARKFASELERLSASFLVNDTSDYELEIRLVKNKTGEYIPFLKLMTLKDERFSYRKNVLPVSMHPMNAALMVKLAEKYLSPDARVLDPFCGVGTCLIERRYLMEAATLYGTDTFGKAIDMARENARAAGIIVNYINRDYFDFTHEHRFDEIITDMPVVTGKHTYEDIVRIYSRFFKKSSELLNSAGVIVMYSNEKKLVLENVKNQKEFEMAEEFVVSKKDERYIFVIKKLK